MKQEPKPHGGRREGAGRKPIGDTPLIRCQILLHADEIEKARALGAGNLCAGIRRAIKEAQS